MTDSFRLIDRIQFLNQQRLQNVKGAQEDMLLAIGELKYEVQLPWDTLWENRLQVGLGLQILVYRSIELIDLRCSAPLANEWQSRWAWCKR